MYKDFIRYVVPSMIAFALSGIYAIVDAFFIGNSMGDIGLAAINIAYPLTSVIVSFGTGIGMGGAIHYAIYKAAKREHEANRYLAISIIMLLVTSLLIMLIFFTFNEDLLRLFGASGELLELSKGYMFYITLGTIFQMLGTGLVPFIRNMNSSFEAMIMMIVGFVGNVFFDYLLVWKYPYGIKGAAIASGMGQAMTALCAIYFLYQKRHSLRVMWDMGWQRQLVNIIKVGISPFGATLIPNITLIFINRSAIDVGGDLAVSSYAVISYVVYVVLLLLQGISDGSQPLISTYYGKDEKEKCYKVRDIAYISSIILSILVSIGIYLYRFEISVLFGASNEVVHDVASIIYIFLIGIPFAGISKITTSYFYASNNNLSASILIYLEPAILIIGVMILPNILGITGTWLATPVSQIIIAILGIIFLIVLNKHKFKTKRIYQP